MFYSNCIDYARANNLDMTCYSILGKLSAVGSWNCSLIAFEHTERMVAADYMQTFKNLNLDVKIL